MTNEELEQAAEDLLEDLLGVMCEHIPGFCEMWCCDESGMREKVRPLLKNDVKSSIDSYVLEQ